MTDILYEVMRLREAERILFHVALGISAMKNGGFRFEEAFDDQLCEGILKHFNTCRDTVSAKTDTDSDIPEEKEPDRSKYPWNDTKERE